MSFADVGRASADPPELAASPRAPYLFNALPARPRNAINRSCVRLHRGRVIAILKQGYSLLGRRHGAGEPAPWHRSRCWRMHPRSEATSLAP